MGWLSRNALVIAVVLVLVLVAAGSSMGAAQEATPAPEIDANGVFISAPDLLQPAPVGQFPAGIDGELTVVGQAVSEDGESLLVIVRNNSGDPQRHVAVSARVLEDGDVVALGASSTSMPFDVLPGGLGLFVVPFSDPVPPPSLVAGAEIRVTTTEDTTFFGSETIDVVDVVMNPDQILLGLASRGQGGLETNSEEVTIVCLSDDAESPIQVLGLLPAEEAY